MPRKRVPKIPELRGTRKFSLLHYAGRFPSFDRTPETERAIQNDLKLCELARHYGISLEEPDACHALLLRVCKDFVPGFSDPTALELKNWGFGRGLPKKWTAELEQKLASEIDKRIDRGVSLMSACNALARSRAFGDGTAETLRRRYYIVKKSVRNA